MSLRNLWKLGRAAASDALARPKSEEIDLPRMDLDLPLGGRIGALLQIENGQFNTAQILGSIASPPSTGQVTITAISRPRPDGWPDDLQLYRYYLDTGDTGEAERYLQVTVQKDTILEIIYFTAIQRQLSGENVGEHPWYRAYDGSLGMGLGERVFHYTRDDLEKLLTKEQLGAIGTAEIVEWIRVGGGESNYVRPTHCRENRIDDPHGQSGIRQKAYFVPYARTLEGGLVEHLWISCEVLEQRGNTEVHVDFMVGIPIPLNSIRII